MKAYTTAKNAYWNRDTENIKAACVKNEKARATTAKPTEAKPIVPSRTTV